MQNSLIATSARATTIAIPPASGQVHAGLPVSMDCARSLALSRRAPVCCRW